jgi:hypothetical protein
MSRIVSFRGLIADGVQDTISLHTRDGSVGYRITKFQIIDGAPGTINAELVCKIYKTEQTTIDGVVDFSDNRLLGVAYYTRAQSMLPIILFDNEIFNQDIYVTAIDVGAAAACNYYIELEQMPLDLNENTVATLKDIRNVA